MTGATRVVFNLRYPGQYADAECGLFYNGFRIYIPTVGRYTQGDPIGLTGGWNRFGYVDANPLNYADPSGLLKDCAFPGGCVDFNPPPYIGPDNPYPLGSPGYVTPPNLLSWTESPRPSPLDATIPGLIVDLCRGISDRMFNRFPDRDLPRNKDGRPIPDLEAEGPYTQLGQRQGRRGKYDQAREFDASGKPVRDIDFTDHGRPGNHTNPHQHDYLPSPTGGTPQHGPARPLN